MSPSLRRLLDETADLIDSPSFSHVLTRVLDAGFSHLIDAKVAQIAYKLPTPSASMARAQELVGTADARAKVASTLAVFCRQAHDIGGSAAAATASVSVASAEGGADAVFGATNAAGNEYLAAMDAVKSVEAFAAVVYSSNFEVEPLDATGRAAGLGAEAPLQPGAAPAAAGTAESSVRSSIVSAEAELERSWARASGKVG